MNISLEKSDAVTGKLTVALEKSDYEENVEKSLKKIKQKAQMPGFRPGMVPMSLVKKMYATNVKVEEVEKLVSSSIDKYIHDEKLNLLVEPLISLDHEMVNIEMAEHMEFSFDLGFRPEIKVELTEKDSLDFYDIQVTDKMVDDQVKMFCSRMGKSVEVEKYETEEDMLRGKLEEAKEGGLVIETTTLFPKYFANKEQAALFQNAVKDGEVIFNVSKAYEGKDAEIAAILKIKKEEIGDHQGDFKFTVATITRFVPSEINQELFDGVCGKDKVKSEEEFRAQVKSDAEVSYQRDSDYKLLMDLRDYMLKKAGDVAMPESILKRNVEQTLKERKEEGKNVDEVYKEQLPAIKWMLIRTDLLNNFKVEINEEKIKDMARESIKMQFAQYGINNVADEMLEKYADNMLKEEDKRRDLVERAFDFGLLTAVKKTVNLNHIPISVEDFNKMFE